MFERLADHGVRTACTPFLIYRGRTRHELGLEGLLRRVALAATFRHATWGPDELFYGELYSSRKVPCKPTLARPGTRDEYSACCGRELVENDLYDFLLFSLPDNDYHSHKFGPDAQPESIARADDALAELVDAAGGPRALPRRARGDRARRPRADRRRAPAARWPSVLGSEWRVLQPNQSDPERAELAVCPSSRAAAVYVLGAGRRARAHPRRGPRRACATSRGSTSSPGSSTTASRSCAARRTARLQRAASRCSSAPGAVLRFRPGSRGARSPGRGLGARRRPGGARGDRRGWRRRAPRPTRTGWRGSGTRSTPRTPARS